MPCMCPSSQSYYLPPLWVLIGQNAVRSIFMADPYPLQVQKGNRMKFNTQLKTHLSSSPHTAHLFHIDKSHHIHIITWQLASISKFAKIGQKSWCARNFWPNYHLPKLTTGKVVWNHKVIIWVTLHSIVTLEPPTIEPNVGYRSRYYRLIYSLNQPKSTGDKMNHDHGFYWYFL